eukprot:TRINITY_DN3691_c0_g1_i5.p1 TRINITY_DN3691_c0_g1~~TRINITY_DN3691_c0_g1_i5.p1  ORF type:complete len:548 (+),score=99.71 TRINITY_DN3691_c0_g1_i5:36-1679(+)
MDEYHYLHPTDCEVIAKAQYVDMLNDKSRNSKYQEAIQEVVGNHTSLVVDIGTGTGVLSIMAAKSGAQSVYGCDLNQSLAAIATRAVKDNQFEKIITIGCKKSTDLVVGKGGDIPHKADVCISEIVDSSLLGEGILPSLRHALQNLTNESHHMIPSSATIFARLVQSPDMWKLHCLTESENFLNFKVSETECSGSSQYPFEVLINSLPTESVESLSDTFEVFSFDFSSLASLESPKIGRKTPIRILKSGRCHGLVLWWVMYLDKRKKITVTTDPDPRVHTWRNHWRQCFYFFGNSLDVIEGNQVTVISSHDDFNLWFKLMTNGSFEAVPPTPVSTSVPTTIPLNSDLFDVPLCVCGMHNLYKRNRIAAMNDRERNTDLEKSIIEAITVLDKGKENLRCILVGDDIFPGLVAARLGVHVVHVESRSFYREIKERQILLNNLQHMFQVVGGSDALDSASFHLLLGDPFYFDLQRMPEWDCLFHFWNEATNLTRTLKEGAVTIPGVVTLQAMAVEFTHFQAQFDEVSVDGIDLTVLNNAVACVKPITVHS